MSDEVLHDEVEQDETTGRRGLLGKAAVAAVVAAATGAGISRPASAGVGNGVSLTQGANNTGATITTSLAGGSTFRVIDGSTAGPTGAGEYKGSIYAIQSADSAAAVIGESNGSGFGWAVYGKNSSSQGMGVRGFNNGLGGLGVYGRDEGSLGIGVYGEHFATTTQGGTGVFGKSNLGVGVAGSGTSADLQAQGSGKVIFSAVGVATPPAGASTIGTLGRDAAGNLWYSPASGVYRKLAGASSAGAFHALTPARVFDSRAAAPAKGVLGAGQSLKLSVADKRSLDTGDVVTANYVPAGATAIACNITVVNTVGGGFLTVNPGGVTEISAATVNWSESGQILNNGVIVTLNANREVTVIAGGGNTDFVIDVTGYFL